MEQIETFVQKYPALCLLSLSALIGLIAAFYILITTKNYDDAGNDD